MSHGSRADLTTGPISPMLWRLAWPMMLSMFFHTLYNFVDAYWVSKLSPESIAAVSISQLSLFLMMSVGMGITVGSGVVMSMDIGAKNIDGAEKVLGQSFVLNMIAGVFFTVVALLFKSQLLTASGATGDIFAPALEYFTVTAGGAILAFILIAIMFAFNAQGDTFTLTKLFATSTFVNVVLDPLLIFGVGPFPAMGIAGAAYATLTSQFVFICLALFTLSRPTRQIQFHFRNLCFKWESVKKVLAIGVPAAMTQVLNPMGIATLTSLASFMFAEAGAIAFSLGFRVEFFAYLPAIGYGFAGMAMMGQSMGAHNMQRARDVFRTTLKYAIGCALGLGVLIAIFAPWIVGAFTDDPTVTHYAILYMRSVSLSYGFLAAAMVEASAFQALGRSWPGFWITLLRFLGVSIPLSYLLVVVLQLPILGVWLGIVAGNIVASIVGHLWISGTMKKFDFHIVDEAVHAVE